MQKKLNYAVNIFLIILSLSFIINFSAYYIPGLFQITYYVSGSTILITIVCCVYLLIKENIKIYYYVPIFILILIVTIVSFIIIFAITLILNSILSYF